MNQKSNNSDGYFVDADGWIDGLLKKEKGSLRAELRIFKRILTIFDEEHVFTIKQYTYIIYSLLLINEYNLNEKFKNNCHRNMTLL